MLNPKIIEYNAEDLEPKTLADIIVNAEKSIDDTKQQLLAFVPAAKRQEALALITEIESGYMNKLTATALLANKGYTPKALLELIDQI